MTTEADYTDADVTRLTEMLGPVVGAEAIARRLLDQGVTLPPPPPDPAVVVAEAIFTTVWPYAEDWNPKEYRGHARLIAAVRDLFPTDALEAAAAKVQEAGS